MEANTSSTRIVRFIAREDAGEYGAASCGHCGADGRYQWSFVTADGAHRAAMAGCIKKFTVSPVAEAHKSLIEKLAKYAGQGWGLNRCDADSLAAIEAFYRDEIDEVEAYEVVSRNAARMRDYHDRKYGRRSYR